MQNACVTSARQQVRRDIAGPLPVVSFGLRLQGALCTGGRCGPSVIIVFCTDMSILNATAPQFDWTRDALALKVGRRYVSPGRVAAGLTQTIRPGNRS